MIVKVLFLLWLINFAPPFLCHIFEKRWAWPVDGRRTAWDGRRVFGEHKTWRGIVGAMVTGGVAGSLCGLGWLSGSGAALASMGGDLLSSFIKRRIGKPSGTTAFGLDQVFEGFFPLLILLPPSRYGWGPVLSVLALFILGAYWGSRFFKGVLLSSPQEGYPRNVQPRVRWREVRACQIRHSPWTHLINFEDAIYYHVIMKTFFRVLRLEKKGRANALDIHLNLLSIPLQGLPESFDGYRILFMSDFHLDGLDGLTERIRILLEGRSFDLCLLGGDFRMENYGPYDRAMEEAEKMVGRIDARDGIYAVFGNHDCPEMILRLEQWGVRFLVNEAVSVGRKGDRLWIVGLDDPHYFRCHDVKEAYRHVPRGSFSIVLAHSPEAYREAADAGAVLYLCGHTHAGQIHFPKIGPLFTHSRAPRRMCQGLWRQGSMLGYTTSGVGVSGAPVRFYTRGEIVVVTLARGRADPETFMVEI